MSLVKNPVSRVMSVSSTTIFSYDAVTVILLLFFFCYMMLRLLLHLYQNIVTVIPDAESLVILLFMKF